MGERGAFTEGPYSGRRVGRHTPVSPGKSVVLTKDKVPDGDRPCAVRLVLRAESHTLYFTVTSGVDDETIITTIRVPKNSARTVFVAMSGYSLSALHPDQASTTTAIAHWRQDEVAGQSSLRWTETVRFVGTGAQVELGIPPFAQSLQLLGSLGLVATLRYYQFDRAVPQNLLATIPVVGAYSDVLPVNDAGIMTLEAAAPDVWALAYKLEG